MWLNYDSVDSCDAYTQIRKNSDDTGEKKIP